MAEQDKPFVCYKNGWSISIKPRNRAGWIALALWLLATLPIAVGFELLMSRNPSKAQEAAYALGLILMMTLWGIAMTIWMMARSEIVNVRK